MEESDISHELKIKTCKPSYLGGLSEYFLGNDWPKKKTSFLLMYCDSVLRAQPFKR